MRRSGRGARGVARVVGAVLCLGVAVGAASVPVRLLGAPPAGARRDTAPDPRLVASLRHLGAALDGGAADRMQGLFPEGFAFTHALVGLSWARVAALDVSADVQAEALAQARQSLAALESEEGRRPFPAEQQPRQGAFHAGWSTYLAGEIAAASGDPAEMRAFAQACRRLGAAFDASATPFLPSYPGAAWPADAAVGVAALALHDRLRPPRYGPTIARWVRGARARLDAETGLVSHAADAATGAPRGGARGESVVLTLRFLAEIDPAFAREQYARFRERFVAARAGLPVVLAYPAGVRGTPDVDSGPVLLGVGLPATVVGLAAARANGDAALAAPLDRELEALGFPVAWGGRRVYGAGVLPVGEAFLVWARLTPAAPAGAVPPAAFPPTARVPVEGIPWGVAGPFGLAAGLALLAAYRLLRHAAPPTSGARPDR